MTGKYAAKIDNNAIILNKIHLDSEINFFDPKFSSLFITDS